MGAGGTDTRGIFCVETVIPCPNIEGRLNAGRTGGGGSRLEWVYDLYAI